MVAGLIFVAVAFYAWSGMGRTRSLRGLGLTWFGLILCQVFLGAATIWSNKAADIATAHVVLGALSLAMGAIITILAARGLVLAGRSAVSSGATQGLPQAQFEPRRPVVAGLE
jgi:cytochrome c oxidase assembly protein subunit 15